MTRKAGGWLAALAAEGLKAKSARDRAHVVGWIDSGNYALNWAISGRFVTDAGYPLGHSVEFFGDPSTGKSFLIDRAIAKVQAQGGVALLDDAEGARIVERMLSIGVDVDELVIERSGTVKEHLAVTQAFLKAFPKVKKPCGLIACDSLSQLSTEHELEVQLDKTDMSKAKELKAFFRIAGNALSSLPVAYLCTSHLIAQPGQMFQKRTTSGGGGPKFYATVRIDLRSPSKLKQGDELVGVLCRVVVDKNRIAAPWKEVSLAIPFYKPISPASGLVDVLTALGILTKRGDFLMHNGEKVGRAYDADDKKHVLQKDEQGEQFLDRCPELLEEVDARLAEQGAWSPGAATAEADAGDDAEDESST